jgi:serine protease Do
MMAPGSSVKLDVLHKGESRTLTLALGEMPNDRQANAGETHSNAMAGAPRLGLQLAPAGEVEGAGDKGVVVTAVDPEGPAAEHGFKEGDIILNVGGKSVSSVGDVRTALQAANQDGKHDVLMQVKTANAATRFIAMPLAKG